MRIRSFPFYKQLDRRDCGPACLRMIARHYGKFYSSEFLREKSFITKQGVSLAGIAEAAEHIGFRTLGVRIDIDTLKNEVPFPCIVPWKQRHFVVVYNIEKDKIQVADPGFGLIDYNLKDFCKGWFNGKNIDTNYTLVLETSPKFFESEEEYNEKDKSIYKFIWPYFKPYKKILFQVILGLFVGTLIQFALPFLLQSIVDYGVNLKNLNFLYIILLGQITLFISSMALRVFRDWLTLHLSNRLGIRMLSDYLAKLLQLPLSFFETRATGEHIQRIQDHNRVQNFFSATTLNTIFSFFTLIVFSAVLFYFDSQIFLIFLFGSLLYIFWSVIFMKRRKLLDYKNFDQQSESQSSLIEILDGVSEIKINNSQRKKRWLWEGIQIGLFKLSMKTLTLSQVQGVGASVINELKNIIVTFLSAKAVIDGEMTLGMMISTQYIIGQLNVPLNNFMSFLQQGQDAKISLERLSQVHNAEDEDDKNSFSSADFLLSEPDDIIIKDLSFRYGGRSSPEVLKKLNFTIPCGKTTAVVGASGSGKTTLLKLLLKFYLPTEGEICVGKRNLKNINSDNWRSKCGSVLQEGYLFNDSIAGNISESEQSGIIDRQNVIDSAHIANIQSYIQQLPNGYNTLIGRRGVSMSGGQKQRILIARAVYKNPNYLFFDEATSALDASNEKIVMERLNKFIEGKTAVVIAHRLSTVKNADNIIVLENGEIVEQGTHKALIENQGPYFQLIKNQLELGN